MIPSSLRARYSARMRYNEVLYGMKKEMLIAVVIGFLLGLVITYGVYRLRIAHNRRPNTPAATATPSATQTATDSLLTIHSPDDGLVQKEKQLTVTGSTIPESYVVLFVNNNENIRESDSEGNFSFEVTLDEGSNILSIQVLTEEGKTITKERTVVVTSLYDEPIPEAEAATKSAKASPTPTPKATIKPKATPTATPAAR